LHLCGAAAIDAAERAEVGAHAGHNAALQTLSVNGPLVTGGEPRLELVATWRRCFVLEVPRACL
jgi:hypothetical protein